MRKKEVVLVQNNITETEVNIDFSTDLPSTSSASASNLSIDNSSLPAEDAAENIQVAFSAPAGDVSENIRVASSAPENI